MSAIRRYELVYITPPEITEEALAELHTQIEAIVQRFDGTIDSTENWGRRKLAYEIERHREGVYVLEIISARGDLTVELDRRLRVNDTVIRHLIIRVDEELAVAERAQSRRKAAVAARRERRGLPPEPEAPPPADGDAAAGDDTPASGGAAVAQEAAPASGGDAGSTGEAAPASGDDAGSTGEAAPASDDSATAETKILPAAEGAEK